MHGGRDVIETTHGPVRGDRKRGVQRWKGIPFAAPPVGELRFAPPVSPDPWTDVREATGRFPIAPQPLAGMEALAGGGRVAEQSEADCLTLNVWTPAVDDGKRPVLFWIHGGAFTTGAGTIPWYDGTNLALRDAVVVSCNYRLGAFGFLHLEGLGGPSYRGSANAGLLDQIAALEWVRDNIAGFGGDPDNVTIFGESAGGMSVGALLGTPAASGLFHKAIPQSGAAANVTDADRATSIAEQVLDHLEVDDVDALRRVGADELLAAQVAVGGTFGTGDGLAFQPVVDGSVLPRPPIDAVAAGSASTVPLLTGSNAHEMRLFTLLDPRLRDADRGRVVGLAERHAPGRGEQVVEAYEAVFGNDPGEVLESMMTDQVFRFPAIELLEAHAAHSSSTFAYEFHFESTAFGGTLGAAHAVEIPFAFDNLESPGASFFTGDPTDSMRALSSAMADAWVSFARAGRPAASGLPEWPVYEPATRATMVLDDEPSVVADPAGPLRAVWSATT